MSKFLKALSRVGLVELDEQEHSSPSPQGDTPPDGDEIDRILAETRAMVAKEASGAAPVPASPVVKPPPPPPSAELLIQGLSMEEIYTKAAIQPCPYPAEQLLRVLDGLAAMDAATRRAAVAAMDAADDNWTIEDRILDAQRKARALMDYKNSIAQTVTEAEAAAERDLAEQEAYRTEATNHIRQQIAELELMLEQELQKVAEQKAAVTQKLSATRDACARESSRFDEEIVRLRRIPDAFGS